MAVRTRPLKVLMVMCSNAGTAYWRFYSWWEAAHRTRKGQFHVLGWDKKEDGMAPWQYQIGEGNHQPRLFGMLYNAGREADVIVFQRLETEYALTTFYALRDQFPNTPILTEIDDDVVDVASYNPAAEALKPGSELTKIVLAQLRNSDGLIVSTPYLKEVYGEYCPHVYVVPNSIDLVRWGKAQRKKKPGVRIGWIGAGSHTEDLRLLEDVIPQVTDKHPEARFVFVSGQLPDFLKGRKNVEIVEKWSPILKYPAHLAAQDFDIGLAPLRDNKFNRAKSNLRWLEYSALGIPTVAARVGHFKETVRDGVDGLLAESSAEWVHHINALVADSKRRREIGRAAFARIQTDFNVDRNVDLYVSALEDVLSRPAMAPPPLLTGVDDMRPQLEPVEAVEVPGIELSPLEIIPEGDQAPEPYQKAVSA